MSTLRIGFANQFYTLWTVDTWTEWGQNSNGVNYSFEKSSCQFHRNLSKDKATAQEKARGFGATNLEVDFSLKGHSYFEVTGDRTYHTAEDEFPFIFRNGGEKIMECEELGQVWALYLKREIVFDCPENPVRPEWRRPIVVARRRLIEEGELVKFEGQYVSPKYRDILIQRKRLESFKSGHFFNVGERVELELKEEKCLTFETQFGTMYIITYVDREGRKFFYKGNSPKDLDEDFTRVVGTVKHDEYKGEKQTYLQRIKIK